MSSVTGPSLFPVFFSRLFLVRPRFSVHQTRTFACTPLHRDVAPLWTPYCISLRPSGDWAHAAAEGAGRASVRRTCCPLLPAWPERCQSLLLLQKQNKTKKTRHADLWGPVFTDCWESSQVHIEGFIRGKNGSLICVSGRGGPLRSHEARTVWGRYSSFTLGFLKTFLIIKRDLAPWVVDKWRPFSFTSCFAICVRGREEQTKTSDCSELVFELVPDSSDSQTPIHAENASHRTTPSVFEGDKNADGWVIAHWIRSNTISQ